MTMLTLAVLAAALAGAQGPADSPELAELRGIETELEGTKRYVYDLLREARTRSRRWGRLFEDGIRAKRQDPFDYERPDDGYPSYGSFRDAGRDAMFREWKLTQIYSRKSEWELEQEWRAVLGSWIEDYRRALKSDEEVERLEKYRNWFVRRIPLPVELHEAFQRAHSLMRDGRRSEAESLLRGWEPWAKVYGPLDLLLMTFDMAKDPMFGYHRRSDYLGYIRDKDNHWQEIDWERDCRHVQALRFNDFLYPSLPGQTPDLDDRKLVEAMGLTSDPASAEALRAFLAEHAGLKHDAVRSGRSRSPCQTIRVDPSGGGDARTIQEAIGLLKDGGYRATILLEPGRYSEAVSIRDGWHLTIRSRIPRSAVLAPPRGYAALWIANMGGVVLDGLSFDLRGGGHAARIYRSNGVTLKHCRISGPADSGLVSEESRDVNIWDTEFEPQS